MSCDTSSTIDAWSCHVMHHLPSMHGHVIWFITYHRCIVMSDDAPPMIMSYDASPTIVTWTFHLIHHLPVMSCDTSLTFDFIWFIICYSCMVIYHLSSIHGRVMWYITYHRCMVMSYDASPTIEAWSCHVIHHLPSRHGHVMWCITYRHVLW